MRRLICALLALGVLAGCAAKPAANPDAAKFKEEYESYNGESADSGKAYRELDIAADNPMVYASGSQVKELLGSGTGIVYFGFPTCPWCRSALPVFLEAAKAKGITKVLYYNNLDQRDKKELAADGSVTTTQEGTPEYYEILGLLGDSASVYDGLNDDTIRRIYYPTFVFVAEGKIIGTQVATLDDVDDPYADLTPEQHDRLLGIYEGLIDKLDSCQLGKSC